MSFASLLEERLTQNGLERFIPLSDPLERLTALLLEFNARTNITAITDPAEIIVKHYADCLTIVDDIPADAHLMDVGAGGGFPSLIVALARPDVRVTALDSTAKKLDFITLAARGMRINNLSVLNMRAEAAGQHPAYRERYDAVCARAVARMNILSELCLPLVRPGGKWIAMKGAGGEEEMTEASRAIAALGGNAAENRRISLLCGDETLSRCIITVQKAHPTPKIYPRAYAQISKKPL